MCDECACGEHSYCGYEAIDNDNHIPLFYTLLYNSTPGRRIINDFPLVLIYLDSLSEYHDGFTVVTFSVVSDNPCNHSLRSYRELSELRGVEALDIAYHNLVSFPVNEVGGIVVTIKK